MYIYIYIYIGFEPKAIYGLGSGIPIREKNRVSNPKKYGYTLRTRGYSGKTEYPRVYIVYIAAKVNIRYQYSL